MPGLCVLTSTWDLGGEYWVRKSGRYICNVLQTSVKMLKLIQKLTGSQCTGASMADM